MATPDPLSTITEPPRCCQHAYERGYRSGYRHGYTYALWDLGRVVRLSTHVWDHVAQFLQRELRPWVWRGSRQGTEEPVSREGGPRLRLLTRRHAGHAGGVVRD